MQLTGPVFLFVFLPLSFLPAILFPRKYRTLVLTLLSLTWYILANRQNPVGLWQIAGLVLACTLIAYLPPHLWKLRTVMGVIFPVASLVTARLLSALVQGYVYPMGLGFIALGAVSLTVDRARGAAKPRSPFDLLAYLLFFPTLSTGPVLRYRHYTKMLEKSTPSPALFCEGIYFYALGYIKRLALAAVLTRTLDGLFQGTATSSLFLLAALLFSLLFIYFFITGTADLARGVAAMYGLRLPRDRTDPLAAASPHGLVFSVFRSFYEYFLDYVARPLRHLLPRVWGEVLAALALWLCLFLFLGMDPVLLPTALPVLISLLIARLRPRQKPLNPILHQLLLLLSLVLCAPCAFALLAGSPEIVMDTVKGAIYTQPSAYYTFFLAIADSRYLVFVLLFLLGVSLFKALLRYRKPSPRITRALSLSLLPIVLVGFVLTLLFFMPQFPQCATALI